MRTLQTAPPMEKALHPAPPPRPRDASRWLGLGVGLLWAGTLLGMLLGLGRVPWPESLLWSALSGVLVGRSTQVGTRRALRWAFSPRTLELGMQDPQAVRRRLERALGRRGYRRCHRTLQVDRFRARWSPDLRIAWSGPGAIVDGPRWLVRVVARVAVG